MSVQPEFSRRRDALETNLNTDEINAFLKFLSERYAYLGAGVVLLLALVLAPSIITLSRTQVTSALEGSVAGLNLGDQGVFPQETPDIRRGEFAGFKDEAPSQLNFTLRGADVTINGGSKMYLEVGQKVRMIWEGKEVTVQIATIVGEYNPQTQSNAQVQPKLFNAYLLDKGQIVESTQPAAEGDTNPPIIVGSFEEILGPAR